MSVTEHLLKYFLFYLKMNNSQNFMWKKLTAVLMLYLPANSTCTIVENCYTKVVLTTYEYLNVINVHVQ